MKKTITFFMLTLLFYATMFAQSLTFYQSDVALENGAEITVTEPINDGLGVTLESHLKLRNNTGEDIEATLTQTVLTSPFAGILSFCYGNCTEGNVDINETNTVEPGFMGSDKGFHLCFYPMENIYETTVVLYEIFPINNTEDKASITVNYIYSQNSGLNDVSDSNLFVEQVGSSIKVKYNFQNNARRQFLLYNSVGSIVENYNINDMYGELSFKAKNGLYIYVVKENDKTILSRKIIIK